MSVLDFRRKPRWIRFLKDCLELAGLHRRERIRMRGESPRLDPKKTYYDPKQFRRRR